MKITRISMFTNKTRTMDLPIDPEVYRRWQAGEGLVQNMFPHLTPSQREFLMTGITDEEWDKVFKEDRNES